MRTAAFRRGHRTLPLRAQPRRAQRQSGLTIIELLVAVAISLLVVLAAAYVFLSSSESQRSLDRNSASRETAAFVLQMLGREIANAGFYPATMPIIAGEITQSAMYETYPPLPAQPRVVTDWMNPDANWPPAAFLAGIFGCDGGRFEVQTSACPAPDAALADTLVINYFTSDALSGALVGRRFDCTGADVARDPSNAERAKNTGGAPPVSLHTNVNNNLPPQLPLFVSNRFTLTNTRLSVEGQVVNTRSLACSGNGRSPHGIADTTAYQPLIPGVEDLQFTYGVYSTPEGQTPDRFYTATEVAALGNVVRQGVTLTPWQRVTAVRVCLLTRTLGGNTRIADAATAPRTYRNCAGTSVNQPIGETVTRYEQVFGLRNYLRQNY